VSVDPDELTVHKQPPPVVIEEMLVDGEALPLNQGTVTVPPGREQFQFRFTAPSFNAPDQCRFRYRIEGLDKRWVTADTRRQAAYGHLAPDHYRFRVVACNSDGVWNKAGASVDFVVLPYFYETRWFQVMMTVLILGGVAIGVRAVATRKYRRALLRLEQQHALEKDRARIAKNIHDHMGAGLTQITLLSELGHREPEHAGPQFERISEAARDLTRAMDETVWAVDPERDTLASLMDYASAYAEDFLRAAGIRCRMEFPTALPDIKIDAELRYNLFLAMKEALNKVVKHAQATEVWLRMRLEANTLTLVIEDNGQGFEAEVGTKATDPARLNSGLGLTNLRNRLHSVHGEFTMHSSRGKGTQMEMIVDLNGSTSPIPVTKLDEPEG
jgi:signal transduction histidine kinase